jgi:hypothetical protein
MMRDVTPCVQMSWNKLSRRRAYHDSMVCEVILTYVHRIHELGIARKEASCTKTPLEIIILLLCQVTLV